MDWSKCITCQKDTKEALRCPAKSSRDDIGAGYRTLALNLQQFDDLKSLPSSIDREALDAQTLTSHEAKWHKSCYSTYSSLKLDQLVEKKRRQDTGQSRNVYTRSNSSFHEQSDVATGSTTECEQSVCFLCQAGGGREKLHQVLTLELDRKLRKCAQDLQDERLIAELNTAGDLVAKEAKYHAKCLASFHNRVRDSQMQNVQTPEKQFLYYESIALAELISYIEECHQEDGIHSFRLADVVLLYEKRLSQLKVEFPLRARINSTNLKDRLLQHIPGFMAFKQGRDVFLAYDSDIAATLKNQYTNLDEETVMMMKIVNSIRQDMFSVDVSFTGQFSHNSQVQSVPRRLLLLVNMLTKGSNILDQSDFTNINQPMLTIAQLLLANACKTRRSSTQAPKQTYMKGKHMPLCIYVGLKVHSLTRKRQLIDSLHDLGISESYDSIMDIKTSLANNVIDYYNTQGVVCPPQLRMGEFVVGAADNIDHNPRSTTATGSFHGTGISLFQNPAVLDDTGNAREQSLWDSFTQDKRARNPHTLLPSYTDVLPMYAPQNMTAPATTLGLEQYEPPSTFAKEEVAWLDHFESHRELDLTNDSSLSWSAYHASKTPITVVPSINSMLPLFPDEASSFAMLRHCLDVIKAAVQHVNPGQTPVVCVDQPLFAKLKQIQWSEEGYSEDNFVVLFGGLHIEMTILKAIGHFLQGSGWVEAITRAGITSAGTAESFLNATHVTRTRNAHQVTACSLYILMKQAFNNAQETNPELEPGIDFDTWCSKMKGTSPQFLFWATCLELELLLLAFVRSLRTGNFELYISALTSIAPFFFVLNHTHYAQWIPLHLRDMLLLPTRHPAVDRQFKMGKFVVAKSRKSFSLLSVDQGHEQNNAVLKDDGGIIGLTQDSEALLKWTTAGPEIVRVIGEFERSVFGKTEVSGDTGHHDETRVSQSRFSKQVELMVNTLQTMGNPFSETENDMVCLHTRGIMPQDSVDCLRQLRGKGKEEYRLYVKERLVEREHPVSDPIKKNKVVLFQNLPTKSKGKLEESISQLKSESSLFGRLYVSCQRREGDLDQFFKHENQPYPPSLSTNGQLRQGKKSDLVTCLEQKIAPIQNRPVCDVTILDGAVIVNMLKPGVCKTFGDYADKIFSQYLKAELKKVFRLDVIWDIYLENSLKAQTREKRSICPSRSVGVGGTTPIPGKWFEFLRNDDNKTRLFDFLNQEALISVETNIDKQLIMTNGPDVCCKRIRNVSSLAPCNHEEADSRIMVHVADAYERGFSKILIRSVDTDVVVLAVATASELGDGLELWLAFGTGKDFRIIASHEIAAALGPLKSYALPLFHAFTGCDTTSYFHHVGKRTAWKVWEANESAITALCTLRRDPTKLEEHVIQALERFTILIYDRTSSLTSIDAARKELFLRKARAMSALLPTKAALRQHILRSVLQGAFHWGSRSNKSVEHPPPEQWGWTTSEHWSPLWTDLPEASVSCQELVRCRCRSRCTDCICAQAGLKCIDFCTCKADCENV